MWRPLKVQYRDFTVLVHAVRSSSFWLQNIVKLKLLSCVQSRNTHCPQAAMVISDSSIRTGCAVGNLAAETVFTINIVLSKSSWNSKEKIDLKDSVSRWRPGQMLVAVASRPVLCPRRGYLSVWHPAAAAVVVQPEGIVYTIDQRAVRGQRGRVGRLAGRCARSRGAGKHANWHGLRDATGPAETLAGGLAGGDMIIEQIEWTEGVLCAVVNDDTEMLSSSIHLLHHAACQCGFQQVSQWVCDTVLGLSCVWLCVITFRCHVTSCVTWLTLKLKRHWLIAHKQNAVCDRSRDVSVCYEKFYLITYFLTAAVRVSDTCNNCWPESIQYMPVFIQTTAHYR